MQYKKSCSQGFSLHGWDLRAGLSFMKILFAILSLQGDPSGALGPEGPPGPKGEPGEPGGGYMVGKTEFRKRLSFRMCWLCVTRHKNWGVWNKKKTKKRKENQVLLHRPFVTAADSVKVGTYLLPAGREATMTLWRFSAII